MHGIGNDFVILDGRERMPSLEPAWLQHLADRRRGVGCDQVLVVTGGEPDYGYRIFNADGQEVEQCGNGVRCVAQWLHDQGAIGNRATLNSMAGPVGVEVLEAGMVRVDMGSPQFDPVSVPFRADQRSERYKVVVDGWHIDMAILSMGNPHAVVLVDSLEDAPVAEIGSALQQHPSFPQAVNVGFARIDSPDQIALRVYERGVGETQACGTGACAAAVAGMLWGLAEPRVTVRLTGGDLVIEWSGEGTHVMMTGPAEYAFAGSIEHS
ncbi:MAG: diaminopimelate epimerase [Xanthomonadales bacterium]|nr:diaminopimelate epimerase [Xanthomonadales bacterium]